MHFLLVDTADERGCVAVISDALAVAVDAHSAGEDYSSWLLPAIKRSLAASSLTLSDVDGYAACYGPGSFTGLRVGLTTVKAWAELYGKPIAPVSRLEALGTERSAAPTSAGPSYAAAVLDARRNQVFAALYDPSGSIVEPESVVAVSDFVERVDMRCGPAPVLWRTPDADLLRGVLLWSHRQQNNDTVDSVVPPFVNQLAALAHRKFLSGQTTDALSLDANYVRRSDAELFWKDHASTVKA